MSYDVQLQTAAHARPTAVVRRRVTLQDLPKVIPDGCGLVWNTLRTHQIKGAGRHVAVYRDEQINLEVGVEMDGPFAGAGEVVPSTLPAGTLATTTHFGPYPLLHQAHRAIRDWCDKHGHALAGPNWDVYGHWLDAWNNDPSQIRTDVFYLLATGGKSSD
jgi:effector-binding domain-containing protein